MSGSKRLGSFFILQIAVGLFFLLLGLQGVLNYDSAGNQMARFFNEVAGKNDHLINLVVSLLSLVSGIIILGGLVVPFKNSTLMIATLIVFIFWALRIVYFYIVNNLMEPDIIPWLQNLSLDCVVLMSVWIINRKYS